MRWLLANAELDRLLEQSPEGRAAHLELIREHDASLATDVASLLEEHHALAAAGLLTDSANGATMQIGHVADVDGGPSDPAGSLAAGMAFGPYRIVRLVGRGGTGAVYEAEEVESGRRVALKLLRDRLKDPGERERFNREGRLAASINHPHCVFVFAALDVDGRLAIAMELMQETLADRLKAHGPLAPAEAVDAVLQLVSGLRAAEATGILHRDIKPSNCFVSTDGVCKIGDFGISRSLRPSAETAFSTRTRYAATPAYASPEQLRGAAYDTRADIYSLGATLYELLTGQPPFQRDELMALLMAVANDAVTPPHVLAPAVPKGLSAVVRRCLAKKQDERFNGYGALAQALEPYSSTAPTAATLGLRLFAGAIDQCLLGLFVALSSFWWLTIFMPLERGMLRADAAWALLLAGYFGIAEAVWHTTPGKAVVGLTVVDVNARSPRVPRTFVRAVVFTAIWTAGGFLWLASRSDGMNLDIVISVPGTVFVMSWLPWVLPVAAFLTARRRNGYAALHDLMTGTRVVERTTAAHTVRSPLSPASLSRPAERVARLGPFDILPGTVPGMTAEWRFGFDSRLCRRVWVREVPPDTPLLDAPRVAISRATRLRWLACRREAHEAWDAFEAVPGVSLQSACARPQAWDDVRWWLVDLARECAADPSGGGPPLRADRVWILDAGGAKLVDDPFLDRGVNRNAADHACATLLLDVARLARERSVDPWPLGAGRFVDDLASSPAPRQTDILRELESLTRQRAVLTRGRRSLHVAGLLIFPFLFAATDSLTVHYDPIGRGRMPLEAYVANVHMDALRAADDGRLALSPPEIEALEIALASRYRHVLTSRRVPMPAPESAGVRAPARRIERVLRRRPTEAQAQRALEHPIVRATEDRIRNWSLGLPSLETFRRRGAAVFIVSLKIVALVAVLAALSFRGGLLRALGLEIVTADGQLASRVRVAARTMLAWSPLIVLALSDEWLPGIVPDSYMTSASGVALVVLLSGAIVAVLRPSRSIQDRLAGTWIVPR